MPNDDGGWRLPEVIDPERVCFTINIPNEPSHLRAFFGAINQLGEWYNWERDPEKLGTQVAQVWRDVIHDAVAPFYAGEGCPVATNVTDIQAVGCEIQIKRPDDIDWQTLIDIADCVPESLDQTLIRWASCGFEQSLDGGGSYTPLKQVYPLDASCRAVAFLAQDAAARLQLYNAAGTSVTRFGITPTGESSAGITLDARNATGGLRIWAAGSGSNRSIWIHDDQGRVSIDTTFPDPSAVKSQLRVVAGNDAFHTIRAESRATQSAPVMAVYRSADTVTGDLIAVNLNGQGDRFRVTKDANLYFRDYMGVYRKKAASSTNLLMHEREVTMIEEGANTRGRTIDRQYRDATAVETSRQEVFPGNIPGIGFLGADAHARVTLTDDAGGSPLLLAIANLLDDFGLADATAVVLGDVPCCDEALSCFMWDFEVLCDHLTAGDFSDWDFDPAGGGPCIDNSEASDGTPSGIVCGGTTAPIFFDGRLAFDFTGVARIEIDYWDFSEAIPNFISLYEVHMAGDVLLRTEAPSVLGSHTLTQELFVGDMSEGIRVYAEGGIIMTAFRAYGLDSAPPTSVECP